MNLLLQGDDAMWCIGFQKIQGQGITILGGMENEVFSFTLIVCYF